MVKLYNTQTVGVRYFSDKIVEQNEVTLENPTSNCKIVKIKADSVCKDCEEVIPKGSRCYTFNPRLSPRYWICFTCLPEPNTMVEREIGRVTENNTMLYYSDRFGRLGQRVDKDKVTDEEWEYFQEKNEDELEIFLRGLHFDDY